jgi:hypothetical protein
MATARTGGGLVGVILVSGLALLGLGAAPQPLPLPEGSPVRLRREVAQEVALPPPFGPEGMMKGLPRLDKAALERYKGAPAERFGAAVSKAQLLLWASSPAKPPANLAAGVKSLRGKWQVTSALKRSGRAPAKDRAAEARFQEQLLADNRALARMIWHLNASVDELKRLEALRAAQPVRWQANYDLVRACLEAQIIVLEHHQLGIAQMRREPPPLDPALHVGWRLVPSRVLLGGDREVRELLHSSDALFARLVKEHPGTVWAELARRAKGAPLGLEWEAVPGGRRL